MEGQEQTRDRHEKSRDSMITLPPDYDPSQKPQSYRPSTREFVRPDIDLSLEQIFKATPRMVVALFETRLRVQAADAVGLDPNSTWDQIHKAQDLQKKWAQS